MYRTRKLYDERNETKKEIYFEEGIHSSNTTFINEKEIRYIRLGINIGCEQNGKGEFIKPVLVIKKIGSMFFCVPLTSKGHNNHFYYTIKSHRFDGSSLIVLSQGRTLDRKRFMDKIGQVSDEEILMIKKLLKEMYL